MEAEVIRKIIDETKKEFSDEKLLYSPNSVYHGKLIKIMSRETQLKEQLGRLDSFLEFLFDHSEHLDHITQSEAWKEFEEFEVKDMIVVNEDFKEEENEN